MICAMRADSGGKQGWSLKRRLSLILLIAITPTFTGCKTWRQEELPTDDFLSATALDPAENRIVGVTTTEGVDVEFSLDVPALEARVQGEMVSR